MVNDCFGLQDFAALCGFSKSSVLRIVCVGFFSLFLLTVPKKAEITQGVHETGLFAFRVSRFSQSFPLLRCPA
jgi:hypothetical protein